MTDSSMLKYQYGTILDQLILLQLHAESPDCPCSLQGNRPGELGEFCEPKHLRSIVALARETIAMEEDRARLDYLENLVLEGSELLVKMELKLCEKEVDLGDYITWSRDKRKPLEEFCYSGFCNIPSEDKALVSQVAQMFRKKAAPRWCHPVKETDKELSRLSRTLGTAKKRIALIQKSLEIPLNICRGQAEMFESSTGVLDPFGSRCRDPETGLWVYSEKCGYEPSGITTTALGMDGITRYEFEFKLVSADKLIVSHDPFTFAVNPNYPDELQPRLRERAATKIQVEKIAANLEPDALITDFHVIDRGTPIIGEDTVVEAGNGRVMGIIKAAADYPEKYAAYKDSLRARVRDYGLSPKDVDSIDRPILVRVRTTDVDRTSFTQEANQAATIAPSAIENARTDAQKITMGMLQELVVGDNESLEDALRAPKNQAFAKRFLATLPENVQAALVDAQGYLNRDGVHRMAMAVFVSAFQGDSGLRLAEKAFESVDMDVRNTVSAIARSLGPLSQAEALTRTGERDANLSIGDDLAQTVNVYSAIKRNPALTVEKYLAQEQIFARELTPFQEGILAVLEEYKRSPRKLAGIFTAYAEGVIAAPPPAQAALFPGTEITKEGLWEGAIKTPEPPMLMEVARMFENRRWKGPAYRAETGYRHDPGQTAGDVVRYEQEELGNDYGIGKDRLTYLDRFPAQAIKWVAKSKRVAAHYNGASPIDVEGHIIIAEDGDGGYLVLDPGRESKLMEAITMAEQACERPSAKYQHLSTFFTESAVEAALFAAEEGSTERKIDTVLAKLQSGIEAIYDSDNFKEFIDTMAKFHRYSLGNIMLITLQKPAATNVAGYTTWQGLGRNVIKGEHGIMILAPCFPPKPKKEEDEEDEEEPEERPVYFKVVHVFDISQTHGEELPTVEVPVITGDETRHLYQKAETYVAKLGITLGSDSRPDLGPNLMGFWNKSENLIWVRPESPQDQRTKTLLHETAHAQCEMRGARDAEVMAESVAYTVANHFGFDTGVRSFPYVALWAKDVKVLKANLEIIRKVAKDMIEGMELVAGLSDIGLGKKVPAYLQEVAKMFGGKYGLIPAVKIEITRAEGLTSEVTGKPEVCTDAHIDGAWECANHVLVKWSGTAPKEGGYDKCDFKVTWEDGETYEGRYDLKHYTIEYPNLAKHIYDFLMFHAGLKKPAHMSTEEYQRYLSREPASSMVPQSQQFLQTYEIGHYTTMGELGNEMTSAGFPLNPREVGAGDIDRFYAWTDKAGADELLSELYERADYLGAHLCIAKEGDNVDREWLEHCPYIGTDDVYTELSRLRFLFYKVTDKLPSSAVILTEGGDKPRFCLSEDDWFALQDAIGKGEKQRAVELMWSKGMKLVLAPMIQEGELGNGFRVEFTGHELSILHWLLDKEAKGFKYKPQTQDEILIYDMLSRVQSIEAELGQGTMGAIGSAVVTGIGIGAGFKIVDAIAKTFRKNQPEEVDDEPALSDEERKELEAVDQALKNSEEV